jgi:hypothetical protein
VVAYLTRTHKFGMSFGSSSSFPLGVSRLYHVTFLFCPCRSHYSRPISSVRFGQLSIRPSLPFPVYVAVQRVSRTDVSRSCLPIVRILRLRLSPAAVQQYSRRRATAIEYQSIFPAPPSPRPAPSSYSSPFATH